MSLEAQLDKAIRVLRGRRARPVRTCSCALCGAPMPCDAHAQHPVCAACDARAQRRASGGKGRRRAYPRHPQAVRLRAPAKPLQFKSSGASQHADVGARDSYHINIADGGGFRVLHQTGPMQYRQVGIAMTSDGARALAQRHYENRQRRGGGGKGRRRGGKGRVASPYTVKTLGDVLGSLHYMGSCPGCRRQFMSRNERIALVPSHGFPEGRAYCLRCAERLGAAHPGGKRRFAPAQLAKGTAEELEHAATIKKIVKRKLPVKKAAAEIAKDHLKEDPHYYDRLEAVAVPKKRKGLKAPRLRLLHRSGKLRVYLVDSHAVRKLYGDWTMGGHHRVYPDFIPPYEVWIAEEVFDPERKLCTLHELNEYKLMGGGQDYDTAHDASTALEQRYRKSKLRGLDAALRKALRAAAGS